MKAYKGFEKQADGSLKCRDFTYEEGKTYELPEKEIKLCERGFHACKELHQCWPFYPHKDESVVYHEVECDGNIIDRYGKVFCSKITIGQEIDMLKLPMFDLCWDFKNGYAVVEKGGKRTYVDTNGEYLINDESERWFDWCWNFENGYAVVREGEKLTYIDTNGNYLIKDEGERWFDWCYTFKNGYARVKKGGKETYVDTNGNYLIKKENERWFDECWDFENGIADVRLDSGEWKKIDANGEFVE